MITDQEILKRFAANPRDGVRILFDKYYASLVLYAEKLLGDRGRAEDVVQEFYIRLWSDRYLERAPVRLLPSYLYAGVRNACCSERSRRDLLRDPVDISAVEIPVEAFFNFPDERVERVTREINHLPERTRLVVQGVMLRGQSYQEVANELSISINTVKFLLKEGVRRLRDKFANGTREILFFLLARR
ncbi:MAG: sigma-70 family RNA polymerase sigma factor [Odoribacteraceae bacterium]|jgi:RNA polymerase sigma-70 factor (ECF subfamily)|nr:sigma-70 family RNA polymerase sigma factor [Odoribacteraceae bacterium]